MADTRYRDGEWLKEQYWDKGLSYTDIGEECGVAGSTISDWMKEHDIPAREKGKAVKMGQGVVGGRYEDEGWLREKYIEEGLSTLEIADICDVHHDTINKYLHKNGIEVRSVKEATNNSDSMGRGKGRDHPRWVEYCTHRWHRGYECWHTDVDGRKYQIMVHRLLAVAKYGLDEIKGMDVHHKNEVRWDNRPGNIELMTPEDHISHHHKGKSKSV